MVRLLALSGLFISGLWSFVTWMSFGLPEGVCRFFDKLTFRFFSREVWQMQNGFYYDVSNNNMPTLAFFAVFTIIFLSYLACIIQLEKKEAGKNALSIIIFFAVVFRLITFTGEMIHENDIYRYLWDAKQFSSGVNPYKYAPSDLFMFEHGYTNDYYDTYHETTLKARDFVKEDVRDLHRLLELRDANEIFYRRIGHWEVPTIYPPFAQILFLVPSWISQDSLALMKFFFVLFDLAALGIIILLLKHTNMNPCFSLVYGWSPLVVMQLSNSGHYDAISIFLTLLAIYLTVKGKEFKGVATLALASLTKFFSAVLWPILVRAKRLKFLNIFVLFIVLFYGPFFWWDKTFLGVFNGLNAYNEHWSYNSSIYALVYNAMRLFKPTLVVSLLPTKLVVGCIYLAALFIIVRKKPSSDVELLRKCFWALALLFLCSPVGDPWYFCWSIPFLCFFRYRSWLLLSGLLVFSYINFHSDIEIVLMRFWNFGLVSLIIYVPFFLILLLENSSAFKEEKP